MKWLSMKIIAIFKADAALNNFYSTRRSSHPESAQESGFNLFNYILDILSLCL